MDTLNLTMYDLDRRHISQQMGGLFDRLSKFVGRVADWVLGPAIPVEGSATRAVFNVPLITCCGGGISSHLWDSLVEAESSVEENSNLVEQHHV